MDMTKEAMEYLVKNAEPHVVEHMGDVYVDKNVTRLDNDLVASPIQMSTLTSLIDYIRSGVDDLEGKLLIHVEAPDRVRLLSGLNMDRKRESLVVVKAEVPEFAYDSYMDHERFLIALQAKFLYTEDRDLLLRFAGTVESGTVAQYGDDGVSQKATVKSGISSKTEAIVPNPVMLRPYRTFCEVEQPESRFVFRMRDTRGVECAVFEADGGAWKRIAMDNVTDFLKTSLEGFEDRFTVIY